MHMMVPRSRSSANVKVIYKGYISQKNGRFGGIRFSQTHLVVFFSRSMAIYEYYEISLSVGTY